MNLSKRARASIGVLGVLMLLFGVLFSAVLPARADEGAGSRNPGGVGGSDGSGWDYRWWSYDNAARNGSAYNTMRNWPGWAGSDYALSQLSSLFEGPDGVCTAARAKAIAQHGGTASDYRTVLVGTFLGDNLAGAGKVPYTGAPPPGALRDALDATWPQLKADLNAKATDVAKYHQYVFELAVDATSNPRTAQACVVLKYDQPEEFDPAYSLSIATEAIGDPAAGGAQAVYDQIAATHTPAGDDWNERGLNATVVLNYRPTTTGWGDSTKSKSKTSVINNCQQAQRSEDFTPADLGMAQWEPGRYWFDVNVPKQQNMKAASNNPGSGVAAVRWQLDRLAPTIATTAQDTFSVSGAKTPVQDKIVVGPANLPSGKVGDATVTLHWDGYPKSVSQASASKQVELSRGENLSPKFSPTDFGWSQWAPGRYWFDVDLKQGTFTSAVNTPDRDTGEVWEAKPAPPVKELQIGGKKIPAGDVVAAAMPFDALISAQGGGSAKNSMSFTDTNRDARVWIGSETADDAAKIYVLDPDGVKIPAAQTKATITTSGDKKIAKVTVSGLTKVGTCTAVFPTTPWPTASDYTIADDSNVCWSFDGVTGETCQDGNSKTIDKETPDPDKVWVLDKDGALATGDPDWANNKGADNSTFVPGDAVSAVVNGRVQTKNPYGIALVPILALWKPPKMKLIFCRGRKR